MLTLLECCRITAAALWCPTNWTIEYLFVEIYIDLYCIGTNIFCMMYYVHKILHVWYIN